MLLCDFSRKFYLTKVITYQLSAAHEHDRIPIRATVLQGGWPLFYIEWGWCWWTRNRLTSKIWWLLECSFWHCWHSFSRTWSNVLRHRKTTPELWRAKEWRFYKGILSRSTPCGRLFLSYSQYSILDGNVQGKSDGRHCLHFAYHTQNTPYYSPWR